jgi:hypothetical protein
MSKKISRCLAALFAALVWMLAAGPVFAVDPDNVGSTLEGCKLPVGGTLPNGSGQFVCADANYTTGNLGKQWNELDLVPFRLTLQAKNAAPATQSYTVGVVVDNENAGHPGYDFLQTLTLNTALSSASCTAATVGPQAILDPGIGGTGKSLYRLVTINNQARGATCVYDFYARLAIGSHLFPGASLHTNMALQTPTGVSCGGTGCADVSIPVNEISPQEISKTMSATQNAERTWNVTKNATPGSLDFGDVCKAPAGPLEKKLEVTVTWTKLEASPSGDVTVVTNISAKNPAARVITINVTDSIYAGQTKAGAVLASKNSGDIDVGANFNGVLTTFTYTVPAASAGSVGDWLNDEAVATYTDKVTGVTVPGTTTAVAKAQIQTGTTINETANIADLESITGTGLTFKVATPLQTPALPAGTFVGYVAGNAATAVNWEVAGLTADGKVVFSKTVVLDQRRITSGSLTDVATLVSTDSGYTTGYTLFPVDIKSSAKVSLKVHKTIPVALKSGEKVVVNFTVAPTAGGAGIPVTVTFNGPSAIGAGADSDPIDNLDPASYTITEGTSTFFDAANPLGKAVVLVPDQVSKVLDLSPKAGGIMDASNCSGTVNFVNSLPNTDLPKAKVAKITLPTQTSSDAGWAWTFTLSGPAGFISEDVTANAGQAAAPFQQPLSIPGVYTVTEGTKTGWDLTKVIQPDASVAAGNSCSFTVTLGVADIGKVFECTFTNTKRGYVKVVKTLKGKTLTTEQFTFQLRQGASGSSEGTQLETLTTNVGSSGSTLNFVTKLLPTTVSQTNVYQMCESVAAGYMTAFTDPNDPLFVPNAFQPPTGVIPNPSVDNSWLCVNFTVAPGQTKTIAVDNAPPPGGRGLTIGYWKTHASCTTSSSSKDTALDRQLYKSSGILKSTKIDSLVFADHTTFGLYGQAPVANKDATKDCPYAVSLLDKRDFNGNKMASDPLFNMAAQLVAAELNLAAGAYTCGSVVNAVNTAEGLLNAKGFTGFGYSNPKLTAAQATLANATAAKLDDYNNNRPGVCP